MNRPEIDIKGRLDGEARLSEGQEFAKNVLTIGCGVAFGLGLFEVFKIVFIHY